MKVFCFFIVICVYSVVVVSAKTNSCEVNEYTKLIKLVSTPGGNHEKCSYESDFNFFHMTALPVEAEYKKMCTSSNCFEFVNEILSDKTFNCTVETVFKFNPYAIAKGFQPTCTKLGVKPLPECGKAAYEAFIKLIPQTSFSGCVKDANFSLLNMKAYPSADKYKKICSSLNCKTLISQIMAYGEVMDCKYQVTNTKFHLNPLKFSESVVEKCNSVDKEPKENNCDGKVLLELNKFAFTTDLVGCVEDTKFPLLEMKAFPSDEEYKQLCRSKRCKRLVNNVLAMGNQIDCDLDLHQLKYNPLKLAASFAPKCVAFETPEPLKTIETPLPTSEANVYRLSLWLVGLKLIFSLYIFEIAL